MINVYENDLNDGYFDQPVIARVKYNERLDYWDGNNRTNGGTGMHKGITKLKKPVNPEKPYVIIIGSQWQGATNYGYCVDALQAASEIVKSGNEGDDWVWPEIRTIIKSWEDCEEDQQEA